MQKLPITDLTHIMYTLDKITQIFISAKHWKRVNILKQYIK